MLRSILTVCFLAFALTVLPAAAVCGQAPLYAKGQQTIVTVPRPEGDRYFIVYVPNSFNESKPTALQFAFHGLNDNCHNFINATNFIPYAETEGYIVVAPCGSIGLLGIAWNSGTCCGFETEEHPNDFAFARQMVEILSNATCVDPNKVAATGFSNGAFMSEVLACESPDLFRAAVSVSGIVELLPGNSQGISRCTQNISAVSTKRPSILMIHGDFDFVVPWTGDELLGFPTVPDNLQGWLTRNDCSADWTQTLNMTHFTNQVFEGCRSGWGVGNGTVQLVRHHGGGHEWPEGHFDTTGYVHDWLKGVFGGY